MHIQSIQTIEFWKIVINKLAFAIVEFL